MNGHVVQETDRFDHVHGGHRFGSRDVKAETLLEFVDAMGLTVRNTLFEKYDLRKLHAHPMVARL